MTINDTRAATAATTVSSHINLHCYLLSKVKDISVAIVGQEKDVFLDFQIQYIFLYVVKFYTTEVVTLILKISHETFYFD